MLDEYVINDNHAAIFGGPEEDPVAVFVYGTLKAGHYNHQWLIDCRANLIGSGLITGFKLVDAGVYPGLIEATTNDKVLGQVWSVPELELQSLDYFEGHPHLFTRQEVDVETFYNRGTGLSWSTKAFVYLYNDRYVTDDSKVISIPDYETETTYYYWPCRGELEGGHREELPNSDSASTHAELFE